MDFSVWSMLKTEACRSPNKTVESLKVYLVNAWAKIPQKKLRAAVESFYTNRVIIAAEGWQLFDTFHQTCFRRFFRTEGGYRKLSTKCWNVQMMSDECISKFLQLLDCDSSTASWLVANVTSETIPALQIRFSINVDEWVFKWRSFVNQKLRVSEWEIGHRRRGLKCEKCNNIFQKKSIWHSVTSVKNIKNTILIRKEALV